MKFKILGLFAAVVLISACGGGSSDKDPSLDIDGDGISNAEDPDDDNDGIDDEAEVTIGSNPEVFDVLFVSKLADNADDSNDGTKGHPLATLQGAHAKADAVYGGDTLRPFTILMTTGEYNLNGTFDMNTIDSIHGGYNSTFGEIEGRSRITFAPSSEAEEYVIFEISTGNYKYKNIFRNLEIVHDLEGIPVRAVFLDEVEGIYTDGIEISNSFIEGQITINPQISVREVILQDNEITGMDGKIKHPIYFEYNGAMTNVGVFIMKVWETVTIKGNSIYSGSPSYEDNTVWRHGIHIGPLTKMGDSENKIDISDNQISCGVSVWQNCEILYVAGGASEITIRNNSILGGAVLDSDENYYRYNIGITVDYASHGNVSIYDNKIDLYDAGTIRGIIMLQGYPLGSTEEEEEESIRETPIEGLTYDIRGNNINVYDTIEDINESVIAIGTSLSEFVGPVGQTTIADNVMYLPNGSIDINFPVNPTTLENNSATFY